MGVLMIIYQIRGYTQRGKRKFTLSINLFVTSVCQYQLQVRIWPFYGTIEFVYRIIKTHSHLKILTVNLSMRDKMLCRIIVALSFMI